MKLVKTCFCAWKNRERHLHHYEGAVKLVETYLRDRMDRDSSFLHCGDAVNLVQGWLSTR